jgi:prepilin-type N-terminal cleavage/methylation domain-containing protein
MRANTSARFQESSLGRKVRRPFAFTLIELMIVIGIVAIIVATGVPPFVRAMRKEGMRKAVSDVVEACSHARAQAILHGAPTELIIREDGQIIVRPMMVRRSEYGPGPAVSTGTAGSSAGTIGFKGSLPDGVNVTLLYVNFENCMELADARVHFFPNGTCDEFTVILASANAEQEISLDVITALANVRQIR